jgi:broad specificity phosphatase PhoE
MPANRLHLVRHGEVHNPNGVLYGRLPHFSLSDLGQRMAEVAAQELVADGRKISALYASPLLRTRESAEPIQKLTDLTLQIDERLIEPTNIFEGQRVSISSLIRQPKLWYQLRNPWQPSWGEPFASISSRMLAAMKDAYESVSTGDVVMVSHQLPIWAAHLKISGKSLAHDPRKRRCALSSITSFELHDSKWVEVDYRNPAAAIAMNAIDQGAV